MHVNSPLVVGGRDITVLLKTESRDVGKNRNTNLLLLTVVHFLQKMISPYVSLFEMFVISEFVFVC